MAWVVARMWVAVNVPLGGAHLCPLVPKRTS
jgi:hypothetical protein